MIVLLFVLALAAPPNKVTICHREGNGSYHLITINENAEDKHRAHGDAAPGERVPGQPWYIFGPGCELCPHP